MSQRLSLIYRRDYTCFDELNQPIIDVALVTPKAGIFVSSIKHLLVVVTAAEIIILGVSFNSDASALGPEGDLIIHRTGLSFPSDEVNMLSVLGSKSGRILAAGQDGNIYEFFYQSEEGWFTRKCRKLNKTSTVLSYFTPTFLRLTQSGLAIVCLAYDADRDLLYTLGEDSSIQAFYLGNSDQSFHKIAHCSDLYEQASRLCPTGLINRKGFKIVSIQAVKIHDSAYINLVAVTAGGIKMYFTALRRDERAWARSQLLASLPTLLPSCLELVHVRLPPEEPQSRDSRRLIHAWNLSVHTAFYESGVTIAASSVSDQEDIIVSTLLNQSLALSANLNSSLEATADVSIEGKVWDIAEIHQSQARENTLSSHMASSSFLESVSPFLIQSRKFLLLSNAGVYVLSKSTPAEELRKILSSTKGNMENNMLRQFFEIYSPEQACFLAIILACSVQTSWKSFGGTSSLGPDSKGSTDLSSWAMNSIIKYGGEPRIIETAISGVDFIGAPDTNSMPASSIGSRIECEFSNLHRGLYLYFSRLVFNFWCQPVLKFSIPSTDVLMSLHAFGEFLARNPALASRAHAVNPLVIPPVKSFLARDNQQKLEEAFQAENASIRALNSLIKTTLELIAFFSICQDYNVLEPYLRYSLGGHFLTTHVDLILKWKKSSLKKFFPLSVGTI